MVAKTLSEDRSSESECRKALSLYMTILHNCKGQVDAYLPLINDIVLAKLGQQMNIDSPLTRISLFQIIASALLYNPQLEVEELEKRGVLSFVFAQWIIDAKKMEKWLPRKLTVLGLSSVLHLPTSAMPASLSSSLPQIVATAVDMVNIMQEDLHKEDEEVEDENIEAEHHDNEDEDEDDEGFAEDEDVTSQTDEAYQYALNKLSQSGDDAVKFLIGENWDDNDDDDEDYTSPIDEIDQLLFFNDSMKVAFQREPEIYQQVQAALPPETVGLCQKMFSASDAQRAA